jgi:hypothetical protein
MAARARRQRSGGHRSGSRSRIGTSRRPEVRLRGTQDAASGAPGGAFLRSQGGRRRLASVSSGGPRRTAQGGLANPRVCRRSAPLKGVKNWTADCGVPGADQTIRAMSHARREAGKPAARCIGCLKFESGQRANLTVPPRTPACRADWRRRGAAGRRARPPSAALPTSPARPRPHGRARAVP